MTARSPSTLSWPDGSRAKPYRKSSEGLSKCRGQATPGGYILQAVHGHARQVPTASVGTSCQTRPDRSGCHARCRGFASGQQHQRRRSWSRLMVECRPGWAQPELQGGSVGEDLACSGCPDVCTPPFSVLGAPPKPLGTITGSVGNSVSRLNARSLAPARRHAGAFLGRYWCVLDGHGAQ